MRARPRGTTNRNDRGSSYARRARKLWLIATYGWPELELVCCWLCDLVLDLATLTVDRYPIPGIEGGTYARFTHPAPVPAYTPT